MEKTAGRRRRQLFAAVSVLGVSLGMADAAQADQNSHKGQTSLKIESQQTGQHSIKYGGQTSHKEHSSIQWGGSHSIKGESTTQHSIKGE